ncbi:hypothetical protein [Archangium primigenium]|uniref:hypothetical protein n=1 Tax=[Archangium] primigenium TaxID=2792470 RepID=UPI0019594E9E|nr:hypothetical protein [Archangium primigenium]MBM7115285.1 hypothetical protein [Archangium primigenium]
MKRTSLLVSAGLLLLLTGCAAPRKAGMCSIAVPREARLVLSAEEWFDLLLHGYDREQGTAARPTLDCSGSPVVWQEPAADECRQPGPDVPLLPTSPRLTDEDLVMATLQADQRLVWVITRRYANGEALGPVGLVERTDTGLVVRALGSLRSFPLHSKLTLERVGGTQVLVAEGEQCTLEGPSVCRRFARLLPLRHGRFFAETVTSQDGKCLGPTWFPFSHEQNFLLPSGLHRQLVMTSTLKFDADGIRINEEVTVHDLDPKRPALPARLQRRVSAERKLQLKGNQMEGTDASLWVRLEEQEKRKGATRLEATTSAQAKSTP